MLGERSRSRGNSVGAIAEIPSGVYVFRTRNPKQGEESEAFASSNGVVVIFLDLHSPRLRGYAGSNLLHHVPVGLTSYCTIL